MTPAERASAVAFALKNCALEALTPGPATSRAAADYTAGRIDVGALIDVADGESPRLTARLKDGPLDDTATDLASAVFARTVLLAERRWNPTGDLDELKSIHRGLFEGVFADAGSIRTTDTARATRRREGGTGHRDPMARNPEAFFPAALIETGALNIATELAEQRNLQALDRPDFISRLSHIYDELGYLHPFLGGNAMTLRIFVSRLAHDAGWDLDWGPATRESYKAAKHAAYRGDVSGFERLFASMTRPANPTRVFLIAGFEAGPAH